nr:MAG TPA: hypothetical protein [Caudoviricetes sp.]
MKNASHLFKEFGIFSFSLFEIQFAYNLLCFWIPA